MPEPTVRSVTDQLRRAAEAQQRVVEAARQAAERPAPATPPEKPPQAAR